MVNVNDVQGVPAGKNDKITLKATALRVKERDENTKDDSQKIEITNAASILLSTQLDQGIVIKTEATVNKPITMSKGGKSTKGRKSTKGTNGIEVAS